MNMYLLFAVFAFLGAAIKYVDQAYDTGIFNKKVALILAAISGILMGYVITQDSIAGMLVLSFVIFAIASRKVDNKAFILTAAFTLIIPLIAILYGQTVTIDWLIFLVFIVSGIIDEEGNRRSYKGRLPEPIAIFFRYRMFMKVTVFLMAALGFYGFEYFIAFILFDLTYLIIDIYSKKLLKVHYSKKWPQTKLKS